MIRKLARWALAAAVLAIPVVAFAMDHEAKPADSSCTRCCCHR